MSDNDKSLSEDMEDNVRKIIAQERIAYGRLGLVFLLGDERYPETWKEAFERWDYISPNSELGQHPHSAYHDCDSLGIFTGFRVYSGDRIFEGDMIDIDGLLHYIFLNDGAFRVKAVGSIEDGRQLGLLSERFKYDESGNIINVTIKGNWYEKSLT